MNRAGGSLGWSAARASRHRANRAGWRMTPLVLMQRSDSGGTPRQTSSLIDDNLLLPRRQRPRPAMERHGALFGGGIGHAIGRSQGKGAPDGCFIVVPATDAPDAGRHLMERRRGRSVVAHQRRRAVGAGPAHERYSTGHWSEPGTSRVTGHPTRIARGRPPCTLRWSMRLAAVSRVRVRYEIAPCAMTHISACLRGSTGDKTRIELRDQGRTIAGSDERTAC